MVFRILDASAFYAGIPFSSTETYYTSSLIYDEIKHIKKNHDAVELLLETKRLILSEPDVESTEKIISKSKNTGDFQQLSKEDISAIALCVQLNGQIVTDDFAVSNVSKELGLEVISSMTSGIKDVGKWIYYCVGCGKNFSDKKQCPLCGNNLKRKLKKKS